jgi:predicted HNH restriction endonuclease
MGKKLLTTPRGRVRSSLRTVWLRSRERAKALKEAGYCCQRCGVKQSRKKDAEVHVEVHHRQGVTNWEKVIDLVFAELLVAPEKLEVLCTDCHKKEHEIK